MRRGAFFDTTGTYRYRLWRIWDDTAPQVCFVLLNPGTADADTDDPTLRRCIGFAQTWGYGGLEIVNLFAFRAADPRRLVNAPNPVGDANDTFLQGGIANAALVIVGWGERGGLHGRDRAAEQMLGAAGKLPYCLGRTKSGQPRHPLYLPRQSEWVPYRFADAFDS